MDPGEGESRADVSIRLLAPFWSSLPATAPLFPAPGRAMLMPRLWEARGGGNRIKLRLAYSSTHAQGPFVWGLRTKCGGSKKERSWVECVPEIDPLKPSSCGSRAYSPPPLTVYPSVGPKQKHSSFPHHQLSLLSLPVPHLFTHWFYLSQERRFLLSFFKGPDLFLTSPLLTSLINSQTLELILFANSSSLPVLVDLFSHFPYTQSLL